MPDENRPTVVLSASPVDLHEIDDELVASGLAIERLEPTESVAAFHGFMQTAFGAVLSTESVDEGLLATCPSLRIIARTGIGTDTIDVDAATRAGVLVTTTPGVNEDTVAEHTVALMLAIVRRITQLDCDVRAGRWLPARAGFGSTVRGSTVGIVGLGTIGSAVARLVTALGANVVVCDPAVSSDSYPIVGLQELLEVSDIVSLHVPLTAETTRLIGAAELRHMRSTAVLVNTARGSLIDEGALVAALEAGRIAGAALDVRAVEPPGDAVLTLSPRIVETPHIGAFSPRTVAQMRRRAVHSVIAAFNGQIPRDALNPESVNARRRSGPHRSNPQPCNTLTF